VFRIDFDNTGFKSTEQLIKEPSIDVEEEEEELLKIIPEKIACGSISADLMLSVTHFLLTIL
jgi:hypothetical protein